MEKHQNLLLDFSHTYPEGIEKQMKNITRIDLSDISGTSMYCSEEAKQTIRERLSGYGPAGIHFLDNGNYHYMTELFVEKIQVPFALVLFDHHNDMQQPLLHDLTSCGSWAGELLHKNTFLRQLILIGPERTSIAGLPPEMKAKVICISVSDAEEASAGEQIRNIDMSLPAYISIDKDVLDHYDARTNWDQGSMSVRTLEKLLSEVFAHQHVIGVDICGESNLQEPVPRLLEDAEINRTTNRILYHFLSGRLSSDSRGTDR